MTTQSPTQESVAHQLTETIYRTRDLEALGLTRKRVRELAKQGRLQALARGLYVVVDSDFGVHVSTLAALRLVPKGIVCLLSALDLHEIGTQQPPLLWIAIGRSARRPRTQGLQLRVVRFSGPALTYGVETMTLDGVDIRVTSPARTIVDCFRYRNKVGLDVALEALIDGLRSHKVTVDQLMRTAGMLRAARVMMPYVTAVMA